MPILKGTVFITDKPEVVYNTPLNQNIRVINMDEDGILMEHPSILVGTCLLPPVQAKIAEADGNEMLYDTIYNNHILEPHQQEFISALLSYLYKGGNLLFFLPELGYTNTLDKFIQIMFNRYGIHIGKIGAQNPVESQCFYDEKCIPIWLNMIYSVRVISGLEYLYQYPEDAVINTNVMDDLIRELSPYGETIGDKIYYINRLHRLVHINPRVKPAIISLR